MTARTVHRSLYLLYALLLFACGDPVARLAPLQADSVILAFGDSITRGNGAERDYSYPAVLEQLSGLRVINAGVPGEITAGGRQRLPSLLDRYQPDLLVLCHGGNDMLRKLDPSELRANLEAMLHSARARGIPVILLGVPRPGLFLLESAGVYDELAEQLSLPYEGDILPAVYSDNALKSDHIHPNAAGYRRIAEAVYRLLRDSGAVTADM